jgi:formylmethanofuran:tetrahydromethanopterin formyltransferase
MKKIVILLLLACSVSNSIVAQKKTIGKAAVKPVQKIQAEILPEINDFDKVLKIAVMTDKTTWSLGVNYKKENYVPIKSEVVKIFIDSFIVSPKSNVCDKFYIKKYKKEIDTLFTNMKFLGDSYCTFLGVKNIEVPIKISNYNVTSKLFLIKGIASTDIYNTLRLTSRQRASKIITTRIIPSLKSLNPILNKEFDFIGFGVVFGSKDFSDKSALPLKEDYVFFISTKSKIIDFNNNKITEDELIQSADVYISDREMSFDVKKVKITLE